MKFIRDKMPLIFLLIILVASAFLRFKGISKLNSFTYDQARDALYIKRILVDHKFRLIGTQTSIPGVYTPPFYYYLMAPALAIFNLNPVGIDYGTVFLNLAALFLLYSCLLNLTQNRWVSLVFSGLYAFNPVVVFQSRFAWNPNTMPFFSLLAMWSLLKIIDSPRKISPYLFLFFGLGMNLNLHYSGIALALASFFSLIIVTRKTISFKGVFWGGGMFFLTLLPLLLFDLRHGFLIIKNIINYIQFGTGGKIPASPVLVGIWQKTIFLLSLIFNPMKLLTNFYVVILGFMLIVFIKYKNDRKFTAIVLVMTLCVIISSFYSGSFFSFYLTPFYPLPFLIFGKFVSYFSKRKMSIILLAMTALVLTYGNVSFSLTNIKPDEIDNFKRLMNIAESLSKKVEENFNLASLYASPDRYDRNGVDYRYFLEIYFNKKTSGWDPNDYKNSQNLYFISQVKEVDPLSINIWEIQTFEPKSVKEKWEIEDVIVYHLIK